MFDPKLTRHEVEKARAGSLINQFRQTPWQQAQVRRYLQAWSVLASSNYRNTVNRNTGKTLKKGVR